jgi:hypothetical protein
LTFPQHFLSFFFPHIFLCSILNNFLGTILKFLDFFCCCYFIYITKPICWQFKSEIVAISSKIYFYLFSLLSFFMFQSYICIYIHIYIYVYVYTYIFALKPMVLGSALKSLSDDFNVCSNLVSTDFNCVFSWD